MTNTEKAKIMADMAGIEVVMYKDLVTTKTVVGNSQYPVFDPFTDMNHLFMVIEGVLKENDLLIQPDLDGKLWEAGIGTDRFKGACDYFARNTELKTALANAVFKYVEQLKK